MPPRRRLVETSLLQNRLVLHRFICREFGYDDMRTMLDRLRDVPAGFDAGGESEYARALYLRRPHRSGPKNWPNMTPTSPRIATSYA